MKNMENVKHMELLIYATNTQDFSFMEEMTIIERREFINFLTALLPELENKIIELETKLEKESK